MAAFVFVDTDVDIILLCSSPREFCDLLNKLRVGALRGRAAFNSQFNVLYLAFEGPVIPIEYIPFLEFGIF